MVTKRVGLLLCCFIGGLAGNDQAARKMFVQNGLLCNKEFPVSGEELEMMIRTHKYPRTKNAQCLLACVFKKMELIDEKGLFDVNGALRFSEKQYVDDKVKIENARKLYELCSKVNKEQVTDGDKGCERSYFLATCLTENYMSMGFSK